MTSIPTLSLTDNYVDSRGLVAREQTGSGASLGKDANIAAKTVTAKLQRFDYLAYAQHLLIENNVLNTRGGRHRTRMCHGARAFNAETISLKLSQDAKKSSATLAGVQTCGSVWSCPVCSQRIAVSRAKEIEQALVWSRANKFTPVMVTLTASHKSWMPLVEFKTSFKAAFRHLQKNGSFQRLKRGAGISRTIKSVEVTRGLNGWHYHYHILLFVPNSAVMDDDRVRHWRDFNDKLSSMWIDALKSNGLHGGKPWACNTSYHGNVEEKYLSKLGFLDDDRTDARYELTSGKNKQSKGRNVWSLLRAARGGDSDAAAAYVEYVTAMQGDNWITWSPKFKDEVGLSDVQDQALADDDNSDVFADWMSITDEAFRPVRHFRAQGKLIAVAETTRSKVAVDKFLQDLRFALDEEKRERSALEHLSRDELFTRYDMALANLQIAKMAYRNHPSARTERELAICNTRYGDMAERWKNMITHS